MISFDPAKHTRQNTLDFKPPLPNPFLQKIFHCILPYLNGKVLNGLSVEIDESSLEKLRALQGERCLLLPNHPSEWDPCVLFEVSKRLKEHFYFVAAREVFDYSYGLRGWIFQRLGVYSLVRGSNDRKSLKTSLEILSENKGRLVIFVEGEISNQNETLLPLESGVIQLAFMALNDVYKDTGKNTDALPPLYVCPVGLKYIYEEQGLDEAIAQAIARLEEALLITATEKNASYERLKNICVSMLQGAAEQLGYPLKAEASLAENVTSLSAFMLCKLEQVLNLQDDPALTLLDRIRRIRNTVDQVLTQTKPEEASPYRVRLLTHQKAVLRNFYEDLDRVVNFIAVYDGYLQPDMSKAQYVELIRRLEKEVFGQFMLVHPRKARVQVQEPINLKDHFPRFLEDKRRAVTDISTEVERKISAGILSH